MKNEEKFKTVEERIEAFDAWCNRNDDNVVGCGNCKLKHDCSTSSDCMAHWLSLESEEEKPENCPFCGGMCVAYDKVVACQNEKCDYRSGTCNNRNAAIAAHNRVARAVRAAEKGKVK